MNSTATIPRRIIQTARSSSLPPLARAAAKNLQLLHPDWEYLFFDDAAIARFISSEFPEFKNVFAAFRHNIQRIDFFRYLVVLRHGGFYFDLDVFLAESLTDLLPCSCVFPFEELTLSRFLREEHGLDWEIGNYGFGAAAGHPFLATIVENCVRAQKEPRWVEPMLRGIPRPFRAGFEVLNTTGPGLVTRSLADDTRSAESVNIIFPGDDCDVCDERNWHRFGRYGVHLMDASWRDRGSFLHRKAALLWENWQRRRLLPESRARGHARLHLPKLA
jgi:hypothetical protein